MFVGDKLTNIRLLHGLSRQDLANILGVSEQLIWQYENSYTPPGLENVNRMKEIFHVRAKFFYSVDNISNEINECNIAYRSSERSSRKKTKSERVHLEYLNTQIKYIERFIKYPKNILLQIREYAIDEVNKNTNITARDSIIEELAAFTRRKIGLEQNNNENLLFLLEKNGAFVFEKSLGYHVDAYSTWSKLDKPYIMLGNVKKSSVRRNFDLAHELGHLILHYKIDMSDLESGEYDKFEREANYFASNFLLPEEEFAKDIKYIKKISNPKSYIDLKEKWKVSLAALGYRAYSLGYMTYQQYRYFNILLHRYNYKQSEPLDSEIPIIRPGKLRSSFQYIFDNGFTDITKLLDFTNFEIPLISKLFDIEPEFFEKYKLQPKVYDFIAKA